MPIAYTSIEMLGLIRRKREELQQEHHDPHPAVALAVGLIYVFRTSAGARIMRELETAIRKYAADPEALWQLVKRGDAAERDNVPDNVIDTTAETVEKGLPGRT